MRVCKFHPKATPAPWFGSCHVRIGRRFYTAIRLVGPWHLVRPLRYSLQDVRFRDE